MKGMDQLQKKRWKKWYLLHCRYRHNPPRPKQYGHARIAKAAKAAKAVVLLVVVLLVVVLLVVVLLVVVLLVVGANPFNRLEFLGKKVSKV